jgi:membrane fusion protein, heavy metal efflux system
MTKILSISLIFILSLSAVDIPTAQVIKHNFGQKVALNAKVIQLSNAKQSIMSLVSGHIEKYYVGPGEQVKAGQKIALIESIMLSQMTADYIALKKQYIAVQENYDAAASLYKKGMTSMQEVNLQSITKNAMSAQISALQSQLYTLGVNPHQLKKASANYILYAHSDGIVSTLLQPLHSVIGEDTGIISIVKDQAYYVESYVPLKYANQVKIGQKIVLHLSGQDVVSHVRQVLPELDEATQRIIILASVDQQVENLFINAYLSATLYFEADQPHNAIYKTALSFFNNEWVVFLPKEEEKESHDKHDEHEETSKYEPHVVKILSEDEIFLAIEGLEVGMHYVSDKSYYAKSMILKSSLGGHGH